MGSRVYMIFRRFLRTGCTTTPCFCSSSRDPTRAACRRPTLRCTGFIHGRGGQEYPRLTTDFETSCKHCLKYDIKQVYEHCIVTSLFVPRRTHIYIFCAFPSIVTPPVVERNENNSKQFLCSRPCFEVQLWRKSIRSGPFALYPTEVVCARAFVAPVFFDFPCNEACCGFLHWR